MKKWMYAIITACILSSVVLPANVSAQKSEMGIERLGTDIRENNLMKKAEHYGIATKNKDEQTIIDEVLLSEWKEKAAAYRVEVTEDVAQMMADVRVKEIMHAAEVLGIDVAGKDREDVLEEILDNYAAEAEAEGLYPFKQEL
ncbi:hypothetical protein CHL76_00855 [Marinococcus halophilus]|uniref:Uncharacterized protein n=1 Tax=Marinococcus halophilus TaxID=1371 RepID=A0A510Y508_MARHA|nr:hypothetical protein [Marinococcus halophilus]OZT81678.1 hypothetical protein CHL76_00855 [Marinococcus halophilus]GEK57627.1 hypothetical protein MHA01_05320 [Marinococcus halophilus]